MITGISTTKPGAGAPEVPRTPELPRTPEIIGAEVRNLTAQAKYISVYFAVQIGQRLSEAKDCIPHGGWLDWLKNEAKCSQSTASRFMRIAAEYGDKQSALTDMSMTNALQLLAIPEDEREAFAAEVDAEHLSARELEAAIKARDEAIKQRDFAIGQAKELTASLKQAKDGIAEQDREIGERAAEIHDLKSQIKELEARPVDVAVTEPDPAEIERRAAELAEEAREEALKQADAKIKAIEADASAEKAKLEDKLKALEKSASEDRAELVQKIREAEAKLAEAQDKPEDSAREEELTALKKQLAMSGAELVAFKLRFTAWQEAYAAMTTALEAVPDAQKKTCEGAIKAVLTRWLE